MSEDRAFAAICAAAADRRPCPTNGELASMLGKQSVSSGVNFLAKLARQGLVKVERFQLHRRVTIVATGASTWVPKWATPHWRAGGRQPVYRPPTERSSATGKPRQPAPCALAIEVEIAARIAVAPPSAPCFRCGCRVCACRDRIAE